MLTGGVTYYFDGAKTISGSALARYEFNGKNRRRLSPRRPADAGVGPGQVLRQLFGRCWWATASGRPATTAAPAPATTSAARHARGRRAGVPRPWCRACSSKARLYKEFSAKAGSGPQTKGTLLRFTLVKAF
jgi:hypothetical protein